MQKRNNKLQIVILIILICILMLLGVFAYLYFFTDILKKPSELFIKYGTQLGKEQEGFINDNIQEYYTKQKTTPYVEKGNIKFDVAIPNLDKELQLVKDFNITFSGKKDRTNNNIEKEINIDYSKNQVFPIKYVKNQDLEGIQTKYVGKRYIAIRKEENINNMESNNEENEDNSAEEDKEENQQQGADVSKLAKKVESSKKLNITRRRDNKYS